MRLLLIGLLAAATGAFAPSPVFAQSQMHGPYGGVVHSVPLGRAPSIGVGGHFGRFGGNFARPRIAHPAHSRAVIVPYPVFYGGYYDGYDNFDSSDSGYGAPPPGYDTSAYGNAAPAQSPVVIINQSFQPETPNPVMHDYSNTPLPPPGFGTPPEQPSAQPQTQDQQPTIYLIAMTDHTILPAIAYWVDGDTLNYITVEGTQNQISLALVDRAFSKKLNDDRHVEFKLPKQQ